MTDRLTDEQVPQQHVEDMASLPLGVMGGAADRAIRLAREVQERRAIEAKLRALLYNDEASRYADGWNHCRAAVIRLLDGET